MPKLKKEAEDRRPMGMQLLVDMTGLQERLNVADSAEFERLYHIPRSRVDQLQDDTWVEIAKDHLLVLLSLAKQLNDPTFEFLQVGRHPIWDTFHGAETAQGFIGRDLDGNRVRDDFKILEQFMRVVDPLDAPSGMPIEDAMRTRNCIIVGGPKHNRYTSAALEALWPAAEPLAFMWDGWPEGRPESRFERRGRCRGLVFRNHEGQPEVVDDGAPDRPSGALVICRSPLGTKEDVTTIIVAGCSKHGTAHIVHDVLAGSVPLDASLVHPGQPLVFILRPTSRALRWYCVQAERVLLEKRAARRAARP